MAVTTEQFDSEFAKSWGANIDIALRNYADVIHVKIAKRAPYLSGNLVRSIKVQKGAESHSYEVAAHVPYAIVRNNVNHLHPQTVHYVQQGVAIARSGGHKRWWKDIS